jgi:hypothetical protein
MKFKSKTEAYSYALVLINQLKAKKIPSSTELTVPFNSCIGKLKVAFENHEQDPNVVVSYLEDLKGATELSSDELTKINQLQKDLVTNDYKQTVKEKYQNPLARRAESELPIVLLHNPTPAMMTSVKRVSDELLKIIEDNEDAFENWLSQFLENAHVIALGSLKAPITTNTIKKILQDNDPNKLAEIMHIHFKFGQGIIRDIPIRHAPHREPVGKLAEIVKSVWKETEDPRDFFSIGLAQGWPGRKYRSHISDVLMYGSDLYTAPGNRGRGGFFNNTRTNQLGLMLNGQEEYEKGLPKHSSSWAADCKCQPADHNSPYVLDLVENDAVYVAGPSGMTSMFLGQMEILANFEDENLKKNYLSAVVSYIVGGGFHSLHEVIGPAQHALDLVPGYNIQAPSYDRRAPAPNYNQFFSQQEAIDPDFAARRELAWQKYLTYVNDSYAPQHIEGFQREAISVPSQQKISSELKSSILSEINSYIKDGALSRGNQGDGLSFITKVFRNSDLTRKKLDIAIEFRQAINSDATTLDELKDLIAQVKQKNLDVERDAGKTYGAFTKSGLNRAMETIERDIADFEQSNEDKKQISL